MFSGILSMENLKILNIDFNQHDSVKSLLHVILRGQSSSANKVEIIRCINEKRGYVRTSDVVPEEIFTRYFFDLLLLRVIVIPITIIGAFGLKMQLDRVKLNLHRQSRDYKPLHPKFDLHFKFIADENNMLHLLVNRDLKNPNFKH